MSHRNVVSACELVSRDSSLVFLDASLTLASGKPSGAQRYGECHIAGARFFDLNEICDRGHELPRMLPAPSALRATLRALGIQDGQSVVVYDQDGLYSAPRVWWMLRALGHDAVSVLDGGLAAWRRAGGETQSGPPAPLPEAILTELSTRSKPQSLGGYPSERVVGHREVCAALDDKAYAVVDARSADRFWGRVAESKAHLQSGHMPGALNLPYSALVTEQGTLVSKNELEASLKRIGATAQQWISSCGSGVTACIFALAMEHYFGAVVRVYDGSWSEWGQGKVGDIQREAK